jgi:hypothetical protein
VGVGREHGCRHRVLEDRLRGALPAAERAAEDREVGHHEVHRVRPETGGQRPDDVADLLVVRAGVLRRRVCHQLGGAHGVAL